MKPAKKPLLKQNQNKPRVLKFLIAGLGNIGKEYEHTRHNVGFEVLDYLTRESSISFSSRRYGDLAEMKYRGKQLLLLKPSTYMNLSGKAIRYWLEQENIPTDRLLVVTDDLALPFGKIRLRSKGSDGGHNGLKNINEMLGHSNYARLRFGIGNEFSRGQQVDYVLDKWSEDEGKQLDERLKCCADVVKAFVFTGVQRAMNDFNKRN